MKKIFLSVTLLAPFILLANDNSGKIAVQKELPAYNTEWTYNEGKTAVFINPTSTTFTTENKPEILNGVTILKSTAPAVKVNDNGTGILTINKNFYCHTLITLGLTGVRENDGWLPKPVKEIDLFVAAGAGAGIQGK